MSPYKSVYHLHADPDVHTVQSPITLSSHIGWTGPTFLHAEANRVQPVLRTESQPTMTGGVVSAHLHCGVLFQTNIHEHLGSARLPFRSHHARSGST